jgi:hypothetical protein
MKAFLASILTVIAMGILAIAYGLLNPRTPVVDAYSSARPMLASERVGVDGEPTLINYPNNGMARYASSVVPVRAADSDIYSPAPRRVTTARRSASTSRVEAGGRDWTKTALVIGGSTAAAAGLGAIFGGKKGALIGAAIGGGASTLYESRKR